MRKNTLIWVIWCRWGRHQNKTRLNPSMLLDRVWQPECVRVCASVCMFEVIRASAHRGALVLSEERKLHPWLQAATVRTGDHSLIKPKEPHHLPESVQEMRRKTDGERHTAQQRSQARLYLGVQGAILDTLPSLVALWDSVNRGNRWQGTTLAKPKSRWECAWLPAKNTDTALITVLQGLQWPCRPIEYRTSHKIPQETWS